MPLRAALVITALTAALVITALTAAITLGPGNTSMDNRDS